MARSDKFTPNARASPERTGRTHTRRCIPTPRAHTNKHKVRDCGPRWQLPRVMGHFAALTRCIHTASCEASLSFPRHDDALCFVVARQCVCGHSLLTIYGMHQRAKRTESYVSSYTPGVVIVRRLQTAAAYYSEWPILPKHMRPAIPCFEVCVAYNNESIAITIALWHGQ